MRPKGLNREASLDQIRQTTEPWDLLVIGGGATGVGVALDAASRNLRVLLLEQSDFGKGTSSRSTKLVHGGVRYLQQGNLTLVRDALRERSLLRRNAPHLVKDMPFLIPCRSYWQRFYYGVGLKAYDLLAIGGDFGRSHGVSGDQATKMVPALKSDGLRGGVVYHDGQFDDARLLINMARTAHDLGACLINYVGVTELSTDGHGKIDGVVAIDHESGETLTVKARCVVNAAGPFCDAVRKLDDPKCEPMLAVSQGVHLVLPRRFFPGESSMIVPKTSDGRVIFIIPWHDKAIVGTTDTAISKATLEPEPQPGEIEFLLDTAAQYLTHPPTFGDIIGVFTGIRPLVKNDRSARTASLSRDHVIRVSDHGLITITGGKWTTVRKMAEDCVDRVTTECGLKGGPCRTKTIAIHGATTEPDLLGDPRSYYGSDLLGVRELEANAPELSEPLSSALTLRKSDIVWAVRQEMARTVDDVLARRSRSLLLDAGAALAIAPEVSRVIAAELGRNDSWREQQQQDFATIAKHYLPHLSGVTSD